MSNADFLAGENGEVKVSGACSSHSAVQLDSSTCSTRMHLMGWAQGSKFKEKEFPAEEKWCQLEISDESLTLKVISSLLEVRHLDESLFFSLSSIDRKLTHCGISAQNTGVGTAVHEPLLRWRIECPSRPTAVQQCDALAQ